MNKFRKAISVGMSAALLASLFTVIAASSALAAITVSGVGTISQGATSAGTATFTFTENSVAALSTTGSMTVTITPAVPGTGSVTFVGLPSFVSSPPGSLGATVTGGAGSSSFTINVTGNDPLNVETLVVGGMKIKASADASKGAIVATLSGTPSVYGAFQGGTTTATGKLAQAYGVGTTTWIVAVDATSPCDFAGVTNVTVGGETRTPTGAPTAKDIGGQQTFTTNAFAVNHLANEVVTQTVPLGGLGTNCSLLTLPSPGTVAVALTYALPLQPTVFPGETNANAGALTISENANTGAGYLAADKTITATISTAGVTFSTAPVATANTPGVSPSTISANSVANPTVVTTTLAHGLVTGNLVTIAGSNSTPTINGTWVVTVLSATTFSVPVNVTVAGTAGTVALVGGLAPSFLFVATPTNSNPAVGTLSADRKSVTWTIKTASAALVQLNITGIKYDVASTVAGGTAVDVTVAYSGGNVQPTSRSNAIVARPVTATSTATTVYIGENGQTAGTISIVENSAGTFTDGTGSYNTFQVCLTTDETFAAAPSATVSVGNLQLRSGAAAVAAGTAVVGTPFTSFTGNPNCYYWTVWAASTTASTVAIGPLKINVPAGLPVGPTNVAVGIGSIAAFDVTTAIQLKVANRVFRNQVVVTALGQPFIPVGSNGSPAGDIQIQETANGQLKANEEICVEILPNQNAGTLYDAFLKGLNTADRPIATGSNGIVVGAVTLGTPGELCTRNIPVGSIGSTLVLSFSVTVSQQSTTGNGKVVFSNIKYATVNDAVTGPVQVNVYGLGGIPTSVQFQSLISNATIGTAPVGTGTAATRLGVTQVGAFTTATKIAKVKKYVTYRFDFGVAAAGQLVKVWGATKSGNDWSAFTAVTSRVANASGVVYYSVRQNAPTWKSYRANWTGGNAWTPARQARWVK